MSEYNVLFVGIFIEMNFYKKSIFIFLLILFLMVVLIKMMEPVVERQFSNIFSDKKISTKLKKELMNSTKDFTIEKRNFYKEVIKKLYIKWKPLINESIDEANDQLKSQ